MSTVIDVQEVYTLIDSLKSDGYEVVAPRLRDKALGYATGTNGPNLPAGLGDEQSPGNYRTRDRGDGALFGFRSSHQSWRRWVFPPNAEVWSARRDNGSFVVDTLPNDSQKVAVVGARACDVAALTVQDKVFLDGQFQDPAYKARRENLLIVAVNCSLDADSNTCFCASMGTGPRVQAGHDIALTEVLDGDKHYFVADAESDEGSRILEGISGAPAGVNEVGAADSAISKVAESMGRKLDIDGLPELMNESYESPRWTAVGERCLSCTSCTMVCPTCFCTNIEDSGDLNGVATRTRTWDSCFTLRHSHIHGGAIRNTNKAKYRQWAIHKMGTWQEQFGTSGCVGCGRCITWCPSGIDITEEVAAIREEA